MRTNSWRFYILWLVFCMSAGVVCAMLGVGETAAFFIGGGISALLLLLSHLRFGRRHTTIVTELDVMDVPEEILQEMRDKK